MVVNDQGLLLVHESGPMTANDCGPMLADYCGPMPTNGYGPVFMGNSWTIVHLDDGPKSATAIGPEKSMVLCHQRTKNGVLSGGQVK